MGSLASSRRIVLFIPDRVFIMNSKIDFSCLSLSWKLLLTGFVVVLGSGYLAAVFNAALSVGMNPQAIADHYADKRLSVAEAAAIAEQGFVEEEFSLDDEDMTEMSMDHQDMGHDMEHGSDMEHSSGDDTLPPQILAQVSHVHLLSFALILISMGGLLCLTQLSETVKAVVVSLLFLSLWGDIISLNLVRFVSPVFSWLTVAMGVTVGLCLAFISLRVLWEVWVRKVAY